MTRGAASTSNGIQNRFRDFMFCAIFEEACVNQRAYNRSCENRHFAPFAVQINPPDRPDFVRKDLALQRAGV